MPKMDIKLYKMFTVGAVSAKLDLNLKGLCESIYSKTKDFNNKKSNVNGWQSSNIIEVVPEEFKNSIITLANSYAKSIHLNKNLKISNMWINRNPPKSYNKEHFHPHCLFAGVYYVTVPENSGSIRFNTPAEHMVYDWHSRNFDEFNEFNSDVWWLPVDDNIMHIFPSWLKHDVTMNESNDTRISISFNVVIDE